ncbi:RAD50-interacting protein 1, partial [Stegodyphus mimosarum]
MMVNMDFNVDAAEFFNTELGEELPSLSKLQDILERISNYERELENEINPHNLDSSHLPSFTENAEKALKQISELTEQCEELQTSAESELVKLEPIKQHFASRVKELQEIQCLHNYLQWILKIEDENCNMEEAMKSDLAHQMIEVYSRFKSYWDEIRTSDCKNLVEYVKKTVSYWHDILKEKFSRKFQKTLQNLHWPVLSTNLTAPLNQSPDVLLKFEQLFMSIHRIALPDEFIKTEDKKESMEDTVLLLPLQIMLQPLQKRFVFHFMSKKPTNRLDKPEWYLTQILTWISDHTCFMEKSVQSILDKEGLSKINARIQLMRGLVYLAIMRLKSDLPCLLDDDRLLSHTIDEILLFSQELQNQGYPLSYPNVMALLTTEPCFTQWRSLEHQSALEKMDKFLSLESAWKSRYQDESDVDDMLVPESAELFVTLLLTMTERYCNLADKECQFSFLELQLELLDDFRLRLHQLSQCEMQDTIQPNYCSIMNAIYYITTVLEEWNNLPFFLQLYAYKKKKLACEELLKDPDKQHMNIMKRKEPKLSIHSEEQLLEASVFDEPIALFQHILKDLLQILCERVMLDIKAKSRPYRKEKWFCMPAVHDKKLLEISPAAHPMLEIINSSLYRLQELLAKPLFTKVWQQIAAELNIYLYEEVILQNSFSEGGAAQLNFDMTRNLFPIFGSYTLKPENYFKLVRDSCVLLNLSSAPAMLLRETLKHQEGFESKSSALEELGVYTLSPSQALLILSQRNYTNL